ncbi:phosphoribosylformylglycinamidine synthase [Klebsiella pneumoniae]|nr:phosphoribosylformylglycinamidine synthase [Klebsiella pneumoniae]
MQALVAQRKLLAYHDRSDGGLLVTLAEMAFTGHCGVEADIAALGDDHLAALFNEELGAVIQVRAADREAVEAILAVNGLADCVHYLGKAVEGDRFVLTAGGQTVFSGKPHHAAHVVGGNHLADAASARQPGLRRSGA